MCIIIYEVLESRILVATVATIVDPIIISLIIIPWITSIPSMLTDRTVYELLVREAQKLSSFYKVGTFESSYGGEGPACAAMSLVLDWGYTTSLNPVDRIGNFSIFGMSEDLNV